MNFSEIQYPTLKDVAKRAGTTAATVSYVLSGSTSRYVSVEMRARVEQAAQELHYVKSSVASSLRGKKRKIIAVLIPQFYNQFFIQMVLRIEEVADRYGYILSTCNTFDDPARENEIVARMQAQRVDGYIIVPSAQAAENTQQIRGLQIPMVVVDRSLDGVDTPYHSVRAQNYKCVIMAAEELLRHGHTHIGYIGWRVGYGGLERREEAFATVMTEHGIPAVEQIAYSGELTEAEGAQLTERLLAEHPETTALLYACNIQARGGIDYLVRRGIHPGRDISVIMVNRPNWSHTGLNDLSCVDLMGEELGQASAELLFQIINGALPRDEIVTQTVECKLFPGSSVIDLR